MEFVYGVKDAVCASCPINILKIYYLVLKPDTDVLYFIC